jgi:hypothetical protein
VQRQPNATEGFADETERLKKENPNWKKKETKEAKSPNFRKDTLLNIINYTCVFYNRMDSLFVVYQFP